MKRVISILLCILMVFGIYIPLPITADGMNGEAGKLPGGGEIGQEGGARPNPCFRIGLINENFPNSIDYTKSVIPQIKAHYKNHFPNMENSKIWVPVVNQTTIKNDRVYDIKVNEDIKLVWCETSSGNLLTSPKENNNKKIQYMNNKKVYSGYDIFYYSLLENVKNNDLSTIGDTWLDTYNKVEDVELKCESILNYIFYQWNNKGEKTIIQKINNICHYEGTTTDPTEKIKNKVGYLQMLMILYGVAADEYKSIYKNAIKRYINFTDMDTNPVLIAVDTITIFTSKGWGTEQLYIPSTEYIEYAAGITEANKLTNPNNNFFANNHDNNFIAPRHQEEIILEATKKSITQRKQTRITDLYGKAFSTTATAWGSSLVYGHSHYLRTVNDYVRFQDLSESETVGMIEALQFIDGVYEGFAVSSLDNLDPPPIDLSGEFGVDAGESPIELDEGSTTIGQNTIVKITGNLTNEEKENWNRFEYEEGYPKIKVTLISNMISNKRDSSKVYGYKGNKLQSTQVTGAQGDGDNEKFWDAKSKDELINFLSGNEPIIFTHDLTQQPIEEEEIQTYNYQATIQIKTSKDGKIITLKGNPDIATKIFKNPKHIPEIRTYSSTPSYWSEIKQGSPYHESFEAMAGVPTTRSLYFATGGSEFIVDITLEYCENEEAIRKYKSYFTGVPSKFKEGDQAGSYTVPSPSGASSSDLTVNVHGGDTNISATWTGSIPNNAKAVTVKGSGSVKATCPADPDMTAYENAMKQADAWASTINGYTISHKAASDGITRNFNSWGASPSGSPHPPEETIASDSKSHTEEEEYTKADGTTGTKTITVDDPCSVTATPSGPGSFTITVKGSIPAHELCGPEHINDMPSVVDTWKQKITYDILKIKDVDVWKIDKSSLNGMRKINGSDEIKASVVQGDPNIFYNIAEEEDSKSGRLRYSIEPQQHDNVVWNEGPRSDDSDGLGRNTVTGEGGQGHSANYANRKEGKYKGGIIYNNLDYDNSYLESNTDAIDKATIEYKKFKERRETENTATVISDFLILQTSSGDQSIMYFEKESKSTNTEDDFEKVTIPLSSLWENNNKSASDMEPEDINIGSYNGKFYNTHSKYNGNGGNVKIKTIFDSDPAHTIVRPSRPSKDLRLMKTGIDIIDNNKNGEYITGKSSVYYKHILDIGEDSDIYIDTNTEFGKGLEYSTKYSAAHNKINDIVIHNPVSTEYAMIIPEDEEYDQRTSKSKIIGGNLVPDTVETESKLKKPHDLQNFIYNGDAEISDSQGNILNWVGSPLNKDVTYESKSSEIISGKNSLTIVANSNLNRTEKYQSTTIGIPNTDYEITAKIKARGCEGYLLVEAYNGEKKLKDWIFGKNHSGSIVNVSETFQTPNTTDKIRVSVVNGASHPNTGSKEIVSADDIRLVKIGSQSDSWETIPYTEYINTEVDNPNYVKPYTIDNPEYIPEKKIPNPDYKPPHKGETKVFNSKGTVQTYTAPISGNYTLEVWGAQGGGTYGGKGGYAKGEVTLTKGEVVNIYVGSQGSTYTGRDYGYGYGGYNGGGKGYGDQTPSGGGGATDIRISGTALSNRVIVAGGGGGQGVSHSASYYGGAGGGSTGGSGGRGGSGGTQTSGYSLGQGGKGSSSVSSPDNGGGGGGWYGGIGGARDEAGGGGGSGYIGGVSNGSMKTGVQKGNGLAQITEPDVKSNGEPEFLTLPAIGDKTIRVNNANYIPASDSYAGDWSKSKISLGNIGISKVLNTYDNFLKSLPNFSYVYPADIMVSKNYIYVAQGNLGHVSKYNKTSNGDIGSYISSSNWNNYAGVKELSSTSSSPAAYAIYTDREGTDHLIGWSKSHSNILDYEINNKNELINKQVINHDAGAISTYSRGGWDGNNNIYFFNRTSNKLYEYDILNKKLKFIVTLKSGNSIMNSSYTGSGLVVDKKNNEVYGCSGANQSNGLIGVWSLSNGDFKGKITGNMLASKGLPTIKDNTGSIQLNPLNRNIAYYFTRNHNKIISLEIVLKNKADSYIPAQGIPWINGLSPTITSSAVIENNVSTPPKNWYELVETKKPANPTIEIPGLGDKTAGDMVVLGRDFDVYFPNIGNFYDDGSFGISHTTTHRGKGFVDHMNTTEWTKKKQVSFNFDVIYKNKMYTVGEYIDLNVNQNTYNFKVPISNSEAISAEVNFRVLANNGSIIDNNKSDTNKKRRPNCSAYHSAMKRYNIDVVGRIGNLVMEDTTDYRFSNYFKNPVTPTKWFIDNVVKKVDIESQNNYLGANVNIFGDPIDSRHYLNTFGSLDFLQKSPKQFPLSPSDNNIQALKKQPTRLGYYMLMDIETVGNYYNNMQIIPYYYSLNLDTGNISPVDVYANVQGSYQPINIYNNVVPDWNTDSVYKNYISLDWLDNSGRRNYGGEEKTITEYMKSRMNKVTENGDVVPIDIPRDNDYKYGITQILQLKERNRTFIGTTTEDGEDFNPGNRIPEYYYNKQAQRWHFSVGVPSSAVFVEAGKELTKNNMDKVMNNKTVILAALDIKASGNTYVLEYEHPEGNNTIDIVGKKYNISSIKHNVVGIYSSEKSSAEDLDTSGTH
ncbi:hypothetical protein SH1V18_11280 [Vallitalea longa]|uniref:receptor protein-tyrosine kinase n=1 Tax=Vallitalea longa TaxID=2936439 RepID=A0A9W5YCB6_9FIRM|nr:glycine-rich protein [Vallitalea longa]GKX28648.1 hypothetical protein SH1V18_11280 [Vallitalea longa]